MSGSVCRVPDSLSPDGKEIRSTVSRVKNRHLRCTNKGNIFGFISYIASKRKNPAKAGFHSGQRRRQSLWPRSRGISSGEGAIRDLVSNSGEKTRACLASSLPRHLFPTLGIKMLWARESNSYRSRGSLHGSRYSRSGATRKGEKAMAGQRKTPTTGAVTVSEPTDRQTPKRAGSAVVTNSRKSGTPVGSGSRERTWNNFPTAWSHARRFF